MCGGHKDLFTSDKHETRGLNLIRKQEWEIKKKKFKQFTILRVERVEEFLDRNQKSCSQNAYTNEFQYVRF